MLKKICNKLHNLYHQLLFMYCYFQFKSKYDLPKGKPLVFKELYQFPIQRITKDSHLPADPQETEYHNEAQPQDEHTEVKQVLCISTLLDYLEHAYSQASRRKKALGWQDPDLIQGLEPIQTLVVENNGQLRLYHLRMNMEILLLVAKLVPDQSTAHGVQLGGRWKQNHLKATLGKQS